jgi:cobalamin biosynthesis protein CobW
VLYGRRRVRAGARCHSGARRRRAQSNLNALAEQRVTDTALSHDDPIEELFEDQIACADLVVLNKRDLIDESGLAKARAAIADTLPRSVKVIAAAEGKVDQKLLLGLGIGTEDDIANRRTHHDDEEEHDHEDFDSFVVRLREVADPAALVADPRFGKGDGNAVR